MRVESNGGGEDCLSGVEKSVSVWCCDTTWMLYFFVFISFVGFVIGGCKTE